MGKLLVVGSVALDTVQTPFGEATEVLGGSATYFAVAASYFTSVDLIAVVGEDFPDQHVKFLKSRGIDLTGLERQRGETFRWKGGEEPVTVDMILATLQQNAGLATRIIRAALPEASEPRVCSCGNALQDALVTAPQNIPRATRKRLRLLLGHRLPPMKGVH